MIFRFRILNHTGPLHPLMIAGYFAIQCVASAALHAQQTDWVQSWLFNGRTETVVRQGLQNQAEQRLTLMKDTCHLSEEQYAKLKLAAAGDVNRFFHEVAQVRKATAGVDQQNQNAIQEAWLVVSPLSVRLQAGIYDEKSLFVKVMSSTLDETQVMEYKRVLREQIDRRHHAMVLAVVSTLEENIPLVGEQREKLIALLDAQNIKEVKQQGMEAYIGYAKLGKVPDEELEKLFDKDQLKALKAVRERYAAIVQMFNQ